MVDYFIQWLLGCAFGLISGWLFASAYYWNKIHKIRYEQFVKDLKR